MKGEVVVELGLFGVQLGSASALFSSVERSPLFNEAKLFF